MPWAQDGGKSSERDFVMPSTNTSWTAGAAYLYILHLDPPALAWEYLRRNPAYREQWPQFSVENPAQSAGSWGLQFR